MTDINVIIGELTRYARKTNIIEREDEAWAVASLLQVFELDGFEKRELPEERTIAEILADALD